MKRRSHVATYPEWPANPSAFRSPPTGSKTVGRTSPGKVTDECDRDCWDDLEFSELRQVWRRVEDGIRKSPNPGHPLEKLIEAGATRDMLLTLLALVLPNRSQSSKKVFRQKQNALRDLAGQARSGCRPRRAAI